MRIWLKCKFYAEGYVNNKYIFSFAIKLASRAMQKAREAPWETSACTCESDSFAYSFSHSLTAHRETHPRLKWIGKIFHFNWWNKSNPRTWVVGVSFFFLPPLVFLCAVCYIKEELLRGTKEEEEKEPFCVRVIVWVNNCFCIENYVNKIKENLLGKSIILGPVVSFPSLFFSGPVFLICNFSVFGLHRNKKRAEIHRTLTAFDHHSQQNFLIKFT